MSDAAAVRLPDVRYARSGDVPIGYRIIGSDGTDIAGQLSAARGYVPIPA